MNAAGYFFTIGGQPQSHLAAITAVPDLQAVTPARGGNFGAVTLSIAGHNLRGGATVKLARSGEPDILGSDVTVAADGLGLTATFDLSGKALGAWDVVVTNPDLQTATLPNGFMIEALAAPQLRVDVLGSDSIRTSHPTAFDLVVQNHGNVDALAVPLWITGIPTSTTVALDFPLSAPHRDPGEPDWSLVPPDTLASPGGRYLALVIPRVPPGTLTRRLYLTVPGPRPLRSERR